MIQGQGPVASPPWATSGVPVSPGRCRGRRPAPHPGNPMGGREDAAPGPPHPRGDDDPRHQGPPRAQPGRAPGRARDRFVPVRAVAGAPPASTLGRAQRYEAGSEKP